MPIYEYECTKCGAVTEELQAFSDPPLTKCEKCKGKLEKLISLSTFHLQGTGWYTTDYANGPGIPPQAQEQDNPALEDSSSNGSSDSADTAATTVAETSGPSSPTETFKSIEKETKKAKNKAGKSA